MNKSNKFRMPLSLKILLPMGIFYINEILYAILQYYIFRPTLARTREKCMQAGMDDYISKPLKSRQIALALGK